MSNKRPNTIIVIILLAVQGVSLLWASWTQGLHALITGSWKPLKNSRLLRIWHWIAVDGPRKFWQFPRSIQIGRSISTLIQVVFYPKK